MPPHALERRRRRADDEALYTPPKPYAAMMRLAAELTFSLFLLTCHTLSHDNLRLYCRRRHCMMMPPLLCEMIRIVDILHLLLAEAGFTQHCIRCHIRDIFITLIYYAR